MRITLGLWTCLALGAATPAYGSSLYETSVIVTGMNLTERQAGLARALGEVLVKVSGNPAWFTDSRVNGSGAVSLVTSITYLDRESNLPKHDEQGTRDRPYDLIVRFDPARIDATLRTLGDAPWPQPRPALAVDLVITPRNGTPLTMHADTDPDERHRGALLAAADRAGLKIVLPLATGTQSAPPGSPVLQGTVTWSDAAFGWVATWTLNDASGVVMDRWRVSGVGFDAAYREGMREAARILSRHP